jgi:hypothetical protein
MPLRVSASFALLFAMSAAAASAQDARPAPAAEFLAGWAGFADDATIDHAVFGGAARAYLTPRLAIGPELVYMKGPNSDRDLFLTGNLTIDLRRPREGKPPSISPFVVAGGGFSQHRDRFGPLSFTSYEGAFTAGGGVRARITDRVYAFGDARIGWELHLRLNGGVGFGL